MALSIKNEEAHSIVRELAEVRGVSLVTAVVEAAREALERERAAREHSAKPRKSRYELLMDFADEYSRSAKNPVHSWEIDNELYGEDGLPK
jgi:hypothetical protein